ncbi:hypothetical protein TrLO_g11584 [Triparma laevis f. longispina]|uniref:BPL/LPL catalytic domain-containing protein n=1 Tax=Triparma laevis f. longispina TaxID=1714387 RepID=A0A9W7F9N2_9STRA|nr:hypothetical protein TrLO_g11584 [Triparma laevis f. longispina]
MSLSSCSSPPPTPTSTLTSSASTPIYTFPVVESTQTTARELLLASSPPSPFSVLAESQDLGKGTNSRIWISPPSNLYLTVVVPSYKLLPPTNTFPLSLIPLKIGTIIHSAISRSLPPTSAASLTLKWPNDVLIDGKKVAGVLIEMDQNCFLIGVGCNVGVAPAVAKEGRELGREAGKLLDYVENTDDAKDVVTKLADYITSDIHAWADNCEGTGDTVVDYFARHVEFNKKIQMRTEQGEGGGRGRWVTPLNLETDGRLRVQAEGGGVEILTSDYMI